MSFRDDLLVILTCGLPALTPAGGVVLQPQPVETIAPEPQLKDTEPFLLAGVDVSQQSFLIGGAVLLSVILLVLVARRL